MYVPIYFYAPNFGKVEGAYCFGLVSPSVCTSIHNLLRYSFEISHMDSSSDIYFFKSGLSPLSSDAPFKGS